jgi:uncharacterized protein (DUF1501 family)
MNRRHFIKSSALASSFLMVPKVLKPLSNIGLQNQQKNLVVIQLSGGNDGLNGNECCYAVLTEMV